MWIEKKKGRKRRLPNDFPFLPAESAKPGRHRLSMSSAGSSASSLFHHKLQEKKKVGLRTFWSPLRLYSWFIPTERTSGACVPFFFFFFFFFFYGGLCNNTHNMRLWKLGEAVRSGRNGLDTRLVTSASISWPGARSSRAFTNVTECFSFLFFFSLPQVIGSNSQRARSICHGKLIFSVSNISRIRSICARRDGCNIFNFCLL